MRLTIGENAGMGMFDTIHFPAPVSCPECGAAIDSVQTKEFASLMSEYHVGSLLRGSSVLKGIIKEEFWCAKCSEAEHPAWHPVYLVVWNSILAGVEASEEAAEKRLASVDRLDLVGWLDESQRTSDSWRMRFFYLLGDIEKWRRHKASEANPNEDAGAKRLSAIYKLPDEVQQAPDPLAALIAHHREEPKRDGKRGGLW